MSCIRQDILQILLKHNPACKSSDLKQDNVIKWSKILNSVVILSLVL